MHICKLTDRPSAEIVTVKKLKQHFKELHDLRKEMVQKEIDNDTLAVMFYCKTQQIVAYIGRVKGYHYGHKSGDDQVET